MYSEDELLTSETTSVSQHFEVQLPAVSASTMGPPPPNSLSIMIPIFTRKQEMGIVASLFTECCVRCKILLSIADQDVTQSNHDDLA